MSATENDLHRAGSPGDARSSSDAPGTQPPAERPGAAPDGATEKLLDGRSARRARNRDAVVDAYIDLTSEGAVEPTSEEVSDRAGVSHRSIYRYFRSRSELLEAAFERVMAGLPSAASVEPSRPAPVDERIREFVLARTAAYREFSPLVRAAVRRAATEQAIAGIVDSWRKRFRREMEEQFSPEIEQLDESSRAVVVDLIDLAFQFESLEYLARELGDDDAALGAVLEIHLHRYLDDLARPA